VNNFKTKVIGLKDRVEDKAQYLAATTAVAISSNPVLNTVRGFAAGNNQIKTKAPKVDKSGNVTFDGVEERFEVHIFDFSDDIYGERVTVYWLDRIRDMVKFNSVDQLVDQLESDEKIARK